MPHFIEPIRKKKIINKQTMKTNQQLKGRLMILMTITRYNRK